MLEKFLPTEGLGVWVQAEEDRLVDQRVLLLCPWAFLDFLTSRTNNRLDFVAVDQASDIWVADLGSWKDVILLVDRDFVKSSENFIKELEGIFCPDNESAKMTTWCELEEVESPDIDELDTRKVTEGLDDAIVLVIDDEGTTALTVSAVAHLTLASTKLARVADFGDISIRVKSLEECDSLLGFLEGLDRGGYDERNFKQVLQEVNQL